MVISVISFDSSAQFNEHWRSTVDSLGNVLYNTTSPDKKARLLLKLGTMYMKVDRDSAIYFEKNALDLATAIGDLRTQTEAATDLGDAYNFIDPVVAKEYCLLAIESSEKLKDPNLMADALNGMGSLKMNTADFEGADDYFLRAIKLSESVNDSSGLAIHFNDFGILLMMTGRYEEGLEYWQRSLEHKLAVGNEYGAASTMSNIAIYYKDIGRYYEAAEYLEKALDIKYRYKDIYGLGTTYDVLGEMNWQLENYPKSLKMYDSAIFYFDSSKTGFTFLESYLGKARVYESMGDYKKATVAWKNYAYSYREFYKENRARISQDLEEKYQTEKKEEENLRLHAQNELKDVRIGEQEAKTALQKTNNRYLMVGLIAALFILIGIGFALSRVRAAKRQAEEQRKIVEEKNQEITDSISYAKRLQEAILPSEEAINNALSNNFVLYKPKDIVAGDFYWMEVLEEGVLIASADCTGHGVPGAMVSVVCHNALNRSVLEFGLRKPGEILDKTTDLVIETFEKSGQEVKDGMDICLCLIDIQTKQVQYAGANNNLYLIRDNSLTEYKADKQPIGKYADRTPFNTQTIELVENDLFYLFTDGYADQFGGEKGKKLKYKPFKELLIKTMDTDLDGQKMALESFFDDWMGSFEQLDDVCVIGVRI